MGESRISTTTEWHDPSMFANLGTIAAAEIAKLSGGRSRQDVPVALNRRIFDYDS